MSKPHFLAWLRIEAKDRYMGDQQSSQAKIYQSIMESEPVSQFEPIHYFAITDKFFPPINPRDNRNVYLTRFKSYRLKPEDYAKLVESFDDAVERYDPSLIKLR